MSSESLSIRNKFRAEGPLLLWQSRINEAVTVGLWGLCAGCWHADPFDSFLWEI